MITIVRPRVVQTVYVIGPRPNGEICASPYEPPATLPNPAFRDPSAYEMPFQPNSSLPGLDWRQAVRHETNLEPEPPNALSFALEQFRAKVPIFGEQ